MDDSVDCSNPLAKGADTMRRPAVGKRPRSRRIGRLFSIMGMEASVARLSCPKEMDLVFFSRTTDVHLEKERKMQSHRE